MNVIAPIATEERWPDEGKEFAWVEERRRNAPGLDSLLRWAHALGASRIDIKTGHLVTIKVHGVIRFATRKTTDSSLSPISSAMCMRRMAWPCWALGIFSIQPTAWRWTAK